MGAALHHKSQVFKCEYSVQWSSTRLGRPSLSGMVMTGRVAVSVRLDMRVHNPTAYDLVVEENRLEIRHEADLVSSSSLAPFSVPAGATRQVPIGFRVVLDPSSLLKGRALLEDHYKFTWYVEVADGVEVPIFLR